MPLLIDGCFCSAILRSHVVLHELLAFYSVFIFLFFNIHRSGVLTALAWLVPLETAAVSAQVLCTPYNHAPCHFLQSRIHKVHACLAVTCHLHFWQPESFTCYCGNTRVERIPKYLGTQRPRLLLFVFFVCLHFSS